MLSRSWPEGNIALTIRQAVASDFRGGLQTHLKRGHALSMPNERPQPCCTPMWTLTRTQEELLRDPEFSDGMDVRQWKPLVEWTDYIGLFTIGHTAIFYCPWCGTRLPDRHEEALAETSKSGAWFAVAADGQVSATMNGEPIDDPSGFLAELKAITKDQD